MLEIWNPIAENLSILDIPIAQKIIIGFAILMGTLGLRGLFLAIIIKRIEGWTSRTSTTLDDELVEILKKPLGWLIVLAGLGLIQLIVAGNLTPEVNHAILGLIGFATVGTFALIVYRAAPLLGVLLSNLSARTTTELDDVIVPYLPLVFRIIAVAIFVLKGGEVLLGASATGILGILGGAGITLGLLFRDILSDWFATLVIYSDNLYRTGDYLVVSGIDGVVQVVRIGIRSTKLRPLARDSIHSMPNSLMIHGRVDNWSQNAGDVMSIGINVSLKIDGIPASQVARVSEAIREIPKSHEFFNEKSVVWFSGFEGNARVINVRLFVKEYAFFLRGLDQLNLDILSILEQEGIDILKVYIRTDPEGYQQWKGEPALN